YYTGPYQLTLQRIDGSATRLSGITAPALSGTAARAALAAANVGQTITLAGSGFQAGDRVVFTTIDNNGTLATSTVAAKTVAADGLSLTVVVPAEATSGAVRP